MTETSTRTHFDCLGLPPRFALDADELERGYLERTRATHPDFHHGAPSAEKRASMELTAALNEAYATLRQPYRRAEYLLALEGGPSASEHKQMDPAFLEEMLELRMEIEELRSDGNHESSQRVAMEKQLTRRSDGLVADLGKCFAQLEKLPREDPGRRGVLLQVRQILNAAKYIQGLLRDLRAD
jgi:molecular chaperone HscB